MSLHRALPSSGPDQMLFGICLATLDEASLMEIKHTCTMVLSHLDQETGPVKAQALSTRLCRSLVASTLRHWSDALHDVCQVFLQALPGTTEALCARIVLAHFFEVIGSGRTAIEVWTLIIERFTLPQGIPVDIPSPQYTSLLGHLYHHRATLFARHDLYQQCLDDCTQALSYQPNSATYGLRGMVQAYMEDGDLEQALRDCTQAIRLSRSSATTQIRERLWLARYYHWRGLVHAVRQEELAALADFEQASQLDSTCEEIARDRAMMTRQVRRQITERTHTSLHGASPDHEQPQATTLRFHLSI